MQRKKILEEKPEPRRNRKKHAVAAVRTIKGEQTLIVWVYGEGKELKWIIGTTKKDYGVYKVSEKKWHQFKISMSGESAFDAEMAKKDLETIKAFWGEDGSKRCMGNRWSWWVEIARERQLQKRQETVWQRRRQKLKERNESLYEIPEEAMKWLHGVAEVCHTLDYTRRGRTATVQCSSCGGKAEYLFEPVTLEDMARATGEKPQHNTFGICTLCGATGIYKAAGWHKRYYTKQEQACILQKTKDPNRVVVRYMVITVGQDASHEQISVEEMARGYVEKGRQCFQIDYKKWDAYRGREYWDDCNGSYYYDGYSIKLEESARLWPGSYKELKGTMLQYCALDRYAASVDELNLIGYLQLYNKHPIVEILVKIGLTRLVSWMANCSNWAASRLNESAKRLADVLQIDSRKLSILREYKGDEKLFRILQYEKRNGLYWSEDVERWLCAYYTAENRYERITAHMTMTKFKNYVDKNTTISTRSDYAHTYSDYLEMRERLGYDMSNTVFLFPRDMQAAHARLIEEQNEKAADERKAKAEEKYPEIKKNYKKLYKKYRYEQGGYQIRPCKNVSEIIDEGRLQHHCVGGDWYLKRHNEGRSYILVLRRKEDPDKPFVTVEIDPQCNVMQWYGAYDKKDNDEIGLHRKKIEAWLNNYTQRKQRKWKQEATMMANQETMMAAV